MTPDQHGSSKTPSPYLMGFDMLSTDEVLRLALGEAFSATLLGIPERDLDIKIAVGERLLLELRKRGIAVVETSDATGLHLSLEAR